MKAFFGEYGGQIVKRYVEAILKVQPRDVADQYVDVISVLCDYFRLENNLPTIWLTLAMDEVPITVFTQENKVKLIETVSPNIENFKRSAVMHELDLLCKRARSSAVRK